MSAARCDNVLLAVVQLTAFVSTAWEDEKQ